MKKSTYFIVFYSALCVLILLNTLSCKKTDTQELEDQITDATDSYGVVAVNPDEFGVDVAKVYYQKLLSGSSSRSEESGSMRLSKHFKSFPLIWERADTVMFMDSIPLIMVPFRGYHGSVNNILQAVFSVDSQGHVKSDILHIQGDSSEVNPVSNYNGHFTHFTWDGEIKLRYRIKDGVIKKADQLTDGSSERCCNGYPTSFQSDLVNMVPDGSGGGGGNPTGGGGCNGSIYTTMSFYNGALTVQYWGYNIEDCNGLFNGGGPSILDVDVIYNVNGPTIPPYFSGGGGNNSGNPTGPGGSGSSGGGGTTGEVNPLDMDNDNVIDYFETDELDDAIFEEMAIQFITRYQLPSSLLNQVTGIVEGLFQNAHNLTPAQLQALITGNVQQLAPELYALVVNQFALVNGLTNQQKQLLLNDRVLFEKIRTLTDQLNLTPAQVSYLLNNNAVFEQISNFIETHSDTQNAKNLAYAVAGSYLVLLTDGDADFETMLSDLQNSAVGDPFTDMMLEQLTEALKLIVADLIPGGTTVVLGPQAIAQFEQGDYLGAMWTALDIILNEADAFLPPAKIASTIYNIADNAYKLSKFYDVMKKAYTLGDNMAYKVYQAFRNRIDDVYNHLEWTSNGARVEGISPFEIWDDLISSLPGGQYNVANTTEVNYTVTLGGNEFRLKLRTTSTSSGEPTISIKKGTYEFKMRFPQ
jgi:hypothetical protein